MAEIDSQDKIIDDIQTGKILPIQDCDISIGNCAKLQGCPTYQIRFSGCNLECTYCNTDEITSVKSLLTPSELLTQIKKITEEYPGINILFTGGEPLQYNRNYLFNHIANNLQYVNFFLKTNGSIPITDIFAENLYYILDFKTPSSNHESCFILDNVKSLRLNYDCINFKMNKQDLNFVKEKINDIFKAKPFLDIYLTPYDDLSFSELSDFVISNKLPVKINL